MTAKSDLDLILYTSISCGATILAEHLPAAAAASNLSSLAATCLEASPQFHLLYTHATNSRLYAFLFSSPLIFFAIADDSLGRSSILLFLRRIRDATLNVAGQRIAEGGPLSHRCLQEELLPIILGFGENPRSEEGDEHEILVMDNNDDDDDDGGGDDDDGGRKSMERIWWQQVGIVVIIDVVVCSLLFGIWLSVCKGFKCVGG